MRTKIELDEKEMIILTMIYELSAAKCYILEDQLIDFLLYFNVYEDKKKIYKAIEGLCDVDILTQDNPLNKYNVVMLTHYGVSQLDQKSFGKKQIDENGNPKIKKLDIKKPVKIRLNMLRAITMRAELMLILFKDNNYNVDFNKALKAAAKANNTVLFTENLDECMQFYNNLPHQNQRIRDDAKYLEDMKKLLANNLPQNANKDKQALEKIETIWTLLKKNIFIMAAHSGKVTYAKVITNFDYKYIKLGDDISFLDDYHRYIFGEDFKFEFQIWVKTKDEATNINDAIQWIELSKSKKVAAYRVKFDYRKKDIHVHVFEKDLDKYFVVKK